jgi:RNA polymerase sigma factor (sigma-70 family)
MANAQLGTVIRYIRDVAVTREHRDKTDRELLGAFLARRDEDAFTALVRRHGPLVLAVCRRMLGHVQDAEDAFQATFLILARHAASIRKKESVASWLYGAAYRMSKNARRAAMRRRRHEAQAKPRQSGSPERTIAWQEVQNLIDEETQHLPSIYREAFILCCLQDRDYAEVARTLGHAEVTIRSRVSRARRQLQKRLSRRGVSLTAAIGVAAIGTNSSLARVPAALLHSTVKAAMAFTAGRMAAGVVSTEVAALVQRVAPIAFVAKLQITTAVLLAVTAATAGLGAIRHQVLADPSSPVQSQGSPAGLPAEITGPFRAYDPFNGKLVLDWKPVRYDPTHVSLTKYPGQLSITTQQGTIYADGKAKGGPRAKNIFVMPNPLGAGADFVITTSISDFTPTAVYQQAGLICYDDDDNYIKWSYEHDREHGDQQLILVRETDAKPSQDPAEAVSGLKRIWLRLTKRGDQYEYAASSDGKKFKVYGERPWGKGAPKKVGILAKNGGDGGVPEIDARFDFFELRSPAPPRDKDDQIKD